MITIYAKYNLVWTFAEFDIVLSVNSGLTEWIKAVYILTVG